MFTFSFYFSEVPNYISSMQVSLTLPEAAEGLLKVRWPNGVPMKCQHAFLWGVGLALPLIDDIIQIQTCILTTRLW